MREDLGVAEAARRQHGLVTTEQARDRGLSDDQISCRVQHGRWVAVRRGVFAINGVPPSWEQTVRAACLAGGAAAVASDLTAGRLWGLGLVTPREIELTTPPGRQVRLPGVRHHRRSTLHPSDITHRGGIPVTSAARTLVDVSGRIPVRRLALAVNDALRRELVGLEDLRACHQRIDTGPGRRATLAMRHVLAEREPGFDPGGSDRELWVLETLTRAGVRRPVQQHPVNVAGHDYILDFAYLPDQIALEFDGWDAHGTFLAFHGDRQRTRRLAAAGWRVLPITARTGVRELVADVQAALALCVR